MIVYVEGKQYDIQEPRPQTLKKYGLEINDWKELLACQGYRCLICGNTPSTGRFVTDHYHVQNYKKMSPEKKRLYIRGLLCWTCNRLIVGRGVTIMRLEKALIYLKKFEDRKPK